MRSLSRFPQMVSVASTSTSSPPVRKTAVPSGGLPHLVRDDGGGVLGGELVDEVLDHLDAGGLDEVVHPVDTPEKRRLPELRRPEEPGNLLLRDGKRRCPTAPGCRRTGC
jgi:hypothetical protein